MMEPCLCACSVALHTRCRSLFAMSSEKENDDPNPVPSKKRKLSLSRKGKGRFSSVSEHQLTVSRMLSGEDDPSQKTSLILVTRFPNKSHHRQLPFLVFSTIIVQLIYLVQGMFLHIYDQDCQVMPHLLDICRHIHHSHLHFL